MAGRKVGFGFRHHTQLLHRPPMAMRAAVDVFE